MKRLAGFMALAVLLSFGTVTTLTYAADPPAPTDEQDKDKKTGGPKLFAAVAEYAEGWMPIGGRGIKAALPDLRRAFEEAGRDPDTVQVKPLGSVPEPGKIEYFASLGVRETVIGLTHGPRDVVLEEMDRYAKIVEPFFDD